MRGPTSWGDVESCLGGGRCLKSGTPAMHCHTALGQWAVQLLQRAASLLGHSGQWNSCNARGPQLGERGGPPRRRSLPKKRNSCNALPHCLEAVGSATRAMHCRTTWRRWAVQLLQCTTPLGWASGQLNSCHALPKCLVAVGSANCAMHYHTAWGRWAMKLLQCAGPPSWTKGSSAQGAVAA